MKLLIEAGADRWGHRLICKIVQEEQNYEETKKRIITLLHAGTDVNIGPGNALTSWLKRQDENEEELALLLFASGERLNKEEIERSSRLSKTSRRDDLDASVQTINQKTSAADE